MRIDSYLRKQLAVLCHDYPVSRKILLVPSRQAGYNVTNWIAREESAWANLQIETALSLAERLALPGLAEQGRVSATADELVFAVHAATSEALSAQPHERVSAIARGPGLTRAMAATVDALRLAEVDPETLDVAGDGSVRRALVADVYRRTVSWMSRTKRYDATAIFQAASAAAPSSRFLQQSVIAVLDETRLSAAALHFVVACRGASTGFFRIGRPDFNVDPPADAAAARFADTPFIEPATEIHPCGQVRVRRLEPADAERVQVRDAVGADSEVRGVFREILTSGTPLDQVELVYTTSEPYVPLIYSNAALLGVNVSFGEGLPVHLTRPGRAAAGFYGWLADDLDAAALVHLLRSRLISFRDGKVSASGLAEVLQTQRARKGPQEHLAALDREVAATEERAGATAEATWLDDRLKRLSRQRKAVSGLLELVPEGEVTVAALADAGQTFLKKYFKAVGDPDVLALESLVDRLETLASIDERAPVPELARLLADLLSRHRVAISAAREGHVYAVPIGRAGYSGRQSVFVVGLDEGSFPGGAIEDPLLPDHERRQISSELGESLGRPAERVWQLLRFAGAVPGRITLVANRFELVDGRERYASSVFAQCRDDLKIETPRKYAPSFAREEALTESEVWVTERSAEGYGHAVQQHYGLLAAGAAADVERSNSLVTRFDGYLGRETPELSPANGQILSASRLERLAACPYRYFLQDVLRVRPLEDADEDDHRWLSPREFGSLVHDVLCAFMSGLKDRGERPDPDRHTDEIFDLAEASAEALKIKNPPETDLAFRADVRRLKATMKVFLAADAGADYEKALEFELRFGYDDLSPRYPNPVRLDLNDELTLRLRGSIDRVDVTRSGFVVWDYKTGSAAPFDRSDLFSSDKLQWALYAHAFRRLIEGLPTDLRVSRSGYYFVGERESGRRIAQEVPPMKEISRRLTPLLSMARDGAFLHYQRSAAGSSPCRFCDFRAVCERERRDKDALEAAVQSKIPQAVLRSLTEWMTA